MQGKRHQPDYVLYFTVVILVAIGVITIFSASTVIALQNHMAANHFAKMQLISAVIGLLLMTGVSYVPTRIWYKLAVPSVMATIPLLGLVFLVGKSDFGGKRWIGTHSLHLQPSEVAIVTTLLYLAFFFTKKVTVLYSFKRGLRPALLVILVNFLLIFKEPDMGTALTLLAACGVIIFVSGTRLKPLLLMAGAVLPILIGLAMSASYRKGRLLAFMHPFAYHNNAAYQLLQGWTAISAGGWFGRGFDASIAKTGYLPFPQTDFIFPIFVEEWGLIGGAALLVTFGVLAWRGFRIARSAQNRFGALLATGITSMITIKAMINLGAISGLLPVTGIPLPFISYGGTSLIVNLGAMGMLLSVSAEMLDGEPDADELAKVVDVQDALDRRAIAEVQKPLPKMSRTSAREGRSSDGKLIRLGRQKHPQNQSSWRARQEAAAARHDWRDRHSQEPRDRKTKSRDQNLTWRERKDAQSTTRLQTKQRSSEGARGKTTTRAKPSRKD